MLYLYIAITVIVSYLLGCFNGAIIISKYFYHKDIRNYGSGNAGLTNFYRTFGGFPTLLVLAIDFLKGLISALLGKFLLGAVDLAGIGSTIGMLAVVTGHVFPVFYRFKGGKGILCGCGALLGIHWLVMVILLGIFIVITVLTRYVSLGSIVACLGIPVTIWFICGHNIVMTVLGLLSAAFMIFMHRANISRLIHRKEPKFSFKSSEGKQ